MEDRTGASTSSVHPCRLYMGGWHQRGSAIAQNCWWSLSLLCPTGHAPLWCCPLQCLDPTSRWSNRRLESSCIPSVPAELGPEYHIPPMFAPMFAR